MCYVSMNSVSRSPALRGSRRVSRSSAWGGVEREVELEGESMINCVTKLLRVEVQGALVGYRITLSRETRLPTVDMDDAGSLDWLVR